LLKALLNTTRAKLKTLIAIYSKKGWEKMAISELLANVEEKIKNGKSASYLIGVEPGAKIDSLAEGLSKYDPLLAESKYGEFAFSSIWSVSLKPPKLVGWFVRNNANGINIAQYSEDESLDLDIFGAMQEAVETYDKNIEEAKEVYLRGLQDLEKRVRNDFGDDIFQRIKDIIKTKVDFYSEASEQLKNGKSEAEPITQYKEGGRTIFIYGSKEDPVSLGVILEGSSEQIKDDLKAVYERISEWKSDIENWEGNNDAPIVYKVKEAVEDRFVKSKRYTELSGEDLKIEKYRIFEEIRSRITQSKNKVLVIQGLEKDLLTRECFEYLSRCNLGVTLIGCYNTDFAGNVPEQVLPLYKNEGIERGKINSLLGLEELLGLFAESPSEKELLKRLAVAGITEGFENYAEFEKVKKKLSEHNLVQFNRINRAFSNSILEKLNSEEKKAIYAEVAKILEEKIEKEQKISFDTLDRLVTIYSELGEFGKASVHAKVLIEKVLEFGDIESALKYANVLLKDAKDEGTFSTLEKIVRVACESGKGKVVEDLVETCLKLASEKDYKFAIADFLLHKSRVLSSAGKINDALMHVEQAEELSKELKDYRMPEILNLKGVLLGTLNALKAPYKKFDERTFNEIKSVFDAAINYARESGDAFTETKIHLNLSHLYMNSGKFDEAIKELDYIYNVSKNSNIIKLELLYRISKARCLKLQAKEIMEKETELASAQEFVAKAEEELKTAIAIGEKFKVMNLLPDLYLEASSLFTDVEGLQEPKKAYDYSVKAIKYAELLGFDLIKKIALGNEIAALLAMANNSLKEKPDLIKAEPQIEKNIKELAKRLPEDQKEAQKN